MNNYKKGQVAHDNKDYDKAISYWKPLANEGHEEAINSMGSLYFSENLIPPCLPQDISQALYYFKKGALKGNRESLFKLGFFYQDGLGVKKDQLKARDLFRRSAAQVHVGAVYAMATNCYSDVQPDYEEAFKCFSILAELEVTQAHFFLADMYMKGKGVDKDLVKAYMHIILTGFDLQESSINYIQEELPYTKDTQDSNREILLNRGVWFLHQDLIRILNPIEVNRAKHLAKDFQKKHY